MNLKKLFTDDDAVSPVIGVILMVAITVILAAVIGAFVLGFGGGGPSAPSVQWDTSGDTSSGVEFEHGGGDTVSDFDTLSVTGATKNIPDPDGNSELTTGEVVEGNSVTASDEVVLIWESPESDSTQELASHSV